MEGRPEDIPLQPLNWNACRHAKPEPGRPGYIRCTGIFRGAAIVVTPNHCHICRLCDPFPETTEYAP